ncbi:MAG: tryptophan-rich sensory protein [Clostridiales bacterium]|nr:MAG: tryptophan-rich sensory protein [Clostridiales bacterium]
MKRIDWKLLIFALAVPLLVGGLAGISTMGSMEFYNSLELPSFAPPGWVFPVAWTILYALMGLASYFIMIQPKSQQKKDALRLYYFQLIINFFWPIIFFNMENITIALFWLIILLIISIATLILFFKEDKRAGWMFLPYVLWLIFATVLNFSVVLLN